MAEVKQRPAIPIARDLLPETTRYLDYFLALTEVGKALTSSLELKTVLEAIMKSLAQLMRPRNWSLLLVDRESSELYFEIAVGDVADAIRELRLKIGEGIAGWVAQRGTAVVSPRVADDPRFSDRIDRASSFNTSSIACVPLVCRHEILGVLELVRDSTEDPFTEDDLQVLLPFADFVAIAIDNARSFQRVQELTLRDEWTGLHNARYLEMCLQDEIARAERYTSELSLVFLDLDNFKLINDTHGHAVGSNVLRAVGAVLRGLTRKNDRAVRYGGDEFVIVLPETNKAGALAFAERVRVLLEERGITGVLPGVLAMTASFGVASYGHDGHTATGLLESADRAMYRAKASGRNIVLDAANVASQ